MCCHSCSNSCDIPISAGLEKQIFEDSKGVLVSVCFERGGKMASSTDHRLFKHSEKSYAVEVNETLSVVATLYKEMTGHGNGTTYQVLLTLKFIFHY